MSEQQGEGAPHTSSSPEDSATEIVNAGGLKDAVNSLHLSTVSSLTHFGLRQDFELAASAIRVGIHNTPEIESPVLDSNVSNRRPKTRLEVVLTDLDVDAYTMLSGVSPPRSPTPPVAVDVDTPIPLCQRAKRVRDHRPKAKDVSFAFQHDEITHVPQPDRQAPGTSAQADPEQESDTDSVESVHNPTATVAEAEETFEDFLRTYDREMDAAPAKEPGVSEGTQTSETKKDEYMVQRDALDIWHLEKKHRTYEQRARLRALYLKSLLNQGMGPAWCIRRDNIQRPSFVEPTDEMAALTRRLSREVAEQAMRDLLRRAREEKIRADHFAKVVKGIYDEVGNKDYNKAEE